MTIKYTSNQKYQEGRHWSSSTKTWSEEEYYLAFTDGMKKTFTTLLDTAKYMLIVVTRICFRKIGFEDM